MRAPMPREYTLHPSATGPASGIDYPNELNADQYGAVSSPPGQALVIAGAGSGKTRTLTYRVAWLLDNGIPPDNILLLTFTNKAAREMLERVQALVSSDTRDLWGGTFHSIGNRLLRRHADRLGYRKGFSIMDRDDQEDLLKSVLAASDVDTTLYRFPKAEVLGDIISLANNVCAPVKDIIHTRYPYFLEAAEGIIALAEAYKVKKLDTNSMDFDDLLIQSARLLREHDDLREVYERQFQFILVDEYQDTNALQCEFIDLLNGDDGNLMVVGDDAQSIYSWRGADVENILRFHQRYPRSRTFKIETNYRSTPEILSLANAAIEINRGQIPKTLRPSRKSRDMLPALVAVDSPSAQANFISQRIHELIDDHDISLNEVAVIYRAHFHSLEVQMELTNNGIPFQITSGLRFFEQAHVKDVACFMKFAVNRRDEVSFMRMVRLIDGVGATSATKLWMDWLKCEGSADGPMTQRFSDYMVGFKTPKKATKAWDQFAYTLDELMDGNGLPVAPAGMIQSVIEGVYADYMMEKFKNYEQRTDDLERLSDYASRFTDVGEFLTQLALVSGVDTDDQPKKSEEDKEAVTLTTAHQAKGLEWKVVFAIWMADGMFPNRRVLEANDEQALEEERRLFYVTVTRAKDELYLLYPVINHAARDGDIVQRPSRFIQDVDQELMDVWKVRRGY
jgi:DNA helicase II / ATP-dependent DNA helicase PcrA